MRRIMSISLPEKLSSQLNAYAKTTGRNKSDIVKESISFYLWDSKFREISRKLGVRAKKAGIVTEEDVFRAIS
jgi:predicted transcriptional regulator